MTLTVMRFIKCIKGCKHHLGYGVMLDRFLNDGLFFQVEGVTFPLCSIAVAHSTDLLPPRINPLGEGGSRERSGIVNRKAERQERPAPARNEVKCDDLKRIQLYSRFWCPSPTA